jgi:hypothetical protein
MTSFLVAMATNQRVSITCHPLQNHQNRRNKPHEKRRTSQMQTALQGTIVGASEPRGGQNMEGGLGSSNRMIDRFGVSVMIGL